MTQRYFLSFLMFLCFLSINSLSAVQPVITNISPAVGSSSGGTTVTITGSGFTGTTAVDFGTVSAASFLVGSDNSISATSPVHWPQVVTVTVTTPGGTSLANNQSFFTFQGDWQAYCTDSTGFVWVIDVPTNTVTTSISIAFDSNSNALAITPDGSQVLVVNNDESSVSVIDTDVNTVVNTITVDSSPDAISITPDGTKAYVVSYSANTVDAIDIASQTVIAHIPVGGSPQGIAITPDGTQAYATGGGGTGTVSVIDTATDTVSTTLSVGSFPGPVTTTPDGKQAYVCNTSPDSNTVSVIDTASNVVTTTIPVGAEPEGIAITPDGKQAYVINYEFDTGDSVSVINTSFNVVTATIPVGSNPIAIAITPDGTQAYVVNFGFNNPGYTVSVISTASNTVTSTIFVGNVPVSVTISPDGTQAYVPNSEDGTISVIDTSTNTVTTTIVINGGIADLVLVQFTADQAPLAQFSETVQCAGMPTTFDASASVSPTGTIANYFWDFGDGNTLSTTNPTVMHTYMASGNFDVSLTVTNTAGTSISQIFNFSSYTFPNSSNSLVTPTPVTNNNGGPTAEITYSVSICTAPPASFTGCLQANEFLSGTQSILKAQWTASPSPGVYAYRIYYNDQFVEQISAGSPFLFVTRVPSPAAATNYSITAVSTSNVESAPVPITIVAGSCCIGS